MGELPGSHLGLLEPVQARWKTTSLDVYVLCLLTLCRSQPGAGAGGAAHTVPQAQRSLWEPDSKAMMERRRGGCV